MIFSGDHYFTICFQMQPHSFTAGKPTTDHMKYVLKNNNVQECLMRNGQK